MVVLIGVRHTLLLKAFTNYLELIMMQLKVW
jgi:hypothetical protein